MGKTRKDVLSDEEYNLLVEDLSCRLPYGVMIAPSDGHFYAEELSVISLDGAEGGITQTKDGTATWLVYTMPYLRPMTSITEDENRPNQETFECVECGYKDNADFNAAKNIKNRVCVTVLRDSLLKQLDNGAFEPKTLKREKVKEVLLSFRRTLQETARSECREGSVTTFDYV